MALQKVFYFFICIFPYYVAHEITKEFWKNSPFENENVTAFFPSEVSKLTSVRKRLTLSLKYWFFEPRVVIWLCFCPKKWSRYHVDTMLTIFVRTKTTSCHIFKLDIFSKFFGDLMSHTIRTVWFVNLRKPFFEQVWPW